MKLLLIRHAQSLGNAEGRIQGQSEYPLSDLGRKQARVLGQRLWAEKWPLSAIYASDQSRAAETAELVAQPFCLPIVLDKRLREYDFGVLNGVIWQQVQVLYPEVWQTFYQEGRWAALPGEEGQGSFQTRLILAMDEIIARHEDDEAVAVVSHGGSLGCILAYLLKSQTSRPHPFHFHNASLTIVELGVWGPILARHNDASHLDRDLR